MATDKEHSIEFFDDCEFDPVSTAVGNTASEDRSNKTKDGGAILKKKAGFYLSVDLLNRFNRKFHELKLAGVAIDNKSTFIEILMTHALDDLDQGDGSRVQQLITGE